MPQKKHAPKSVPCPAGPSLGQDAVGAGFGSLLLDDDGFADQLGAHASLLEGAVEAGNSFVADALAKADAAASAFAGGQSATFAADGVAAGTALGEALDLLGEIDAAESPGWSQEIQDAMDETPSLRASADAVAPTLLTPLDLDLGLDLARNLTGRADERLDSAVLVASLHLDAGLALRAQADVLADLEGAGAMSAAQTLATGYRDGAKQAGTEAFYNRHVEESEASDTLKGYFAFAMGVESSRYYGEYDDEAQVSQITDPGVLAAMKQAEEAHNAQVKSASTDLGKMRDPLGGGLARRGGALVDLLVANPGDKAKLGVQVEVPLASAGAASAGLHLEFESELENDAGQYKLRCKLGIGVEAELDVGLAELEIAVGALGVIEASGDSGGELFDLMLYGVSDAIERAAPRGHALLFGGFDAKAVEDRMDADDYVEAGIGLFAQASAERDAGDDDDEATLRYEYLTGTRLQKKRDGGPVERKGFEDHTAMLTVELPAGGVELKARGRVGNEGLEKLDIEGKGMLHLDPQALRKNLDEGGIFPAVLQQGAELAGRIGGLAGDDEGGRSLQSDIGAAARMGGVDRRVLAGADDVLASRELGNTRQTYAAGVTISHEGGELAMEVSLEEINTIEVEAGAGVEVEAVAEMSRMIAKVKVV